MFFMSMLLVHEDPFQFSLFADTRSVMSGVWVGDCFVFTTFANKLVYYVGGQTYPVATLERALYIIGYLPASERVYLADKDCSVYSYSLSLSVIEYQMNILRGDLTAARELLPKLPETELASIAKFLESHHFQEEAMNVTTDEEHRFALALELKHTEVAMSIADKQASDTKWSQLARLSLAEWNVIFFLFSFSPLLIDLFSHAHIRLCPVLTIVCIDDSRFHWQRNASNSQRICLIYCC